MANLIVKKLDFLLFIIFIKQVSNRNRVSLKKLDLIFSFDSSLKKRESEMWLQN